MEKSNNKKKKTDIANKRHKRFYKGMLPFVSLFVKHKMGFEIPKEAPEIPTPSIIIANHTTDYDMLMVASAIKAHMYFVGSEHAMRKGLGTDLMEYFISPISREKATVATSTVLKMKRRLKAGNNICIFAEGIRSGDGKSQEIHPSTGGVVRALGASLVTFKFHGGYYTSPRWAKTGRKGKMWGEISGIYSAEVLKGMTDDQVNEIINRDIFVDAFKDNEEANIEYVGKGLAEGIEFELVRCPKCGKFGTITSVGDEFSCPCGLKGHFTSRGKLIGEGFGFTSISEWNEWQKKSIDEQEFSGEEEIVGNDKQILREVDSHVAKEIAQGRISLSRKTLKVGEFNIPISQIANIDMIGHGYLLLTTTEGKYYEIKNKKEKFPGYLYVLLVKRLGKEC